MSHHCWTVHTMEWGTTTANIMRMPVLSATLVSSCLQINGLLELYLQTLSVFFSMRVLEDMVQNPSHVSVCKYIGSPD